MVNSQGREPLVTETTDGLSPNGAAVMWHATVVPLGLSAALRVVNQGLAPNGTYFVICLASGLSCLVDCCMNFVDLGRRG